MGICSLNLVDMNPVLTVTSCNRWVLFWPWCPIPELRYSQCTLMTSVKLHLDCSVSPKGPSPIVECFQNPNNVRYSVGWVGRCSYMKGSICDQCYRRGRPVTAFI